LDDFADPVHLPKLKTGVVLRGMFGDLLFFTMKVQRCATESRS
jgi:hypothetical protein